MEERERPGSEDRPKPPAQGPIPGMERPRSDPRPGPHSPPPPAEEEARPSSQPGTG